MSKTRAFEQLRKIAETLEFSEWKPDKWSPAHAEDDCPGFRTIHVTISQPK